MKIKKILPFAVAMAIGVGIGFIIPKVTATSQKTTPQSVWIHPRPGAGTAEYLYPNVNKAGEDWEVSYQLSSDPYASMVYVD